MLPWRVTAAPAELRGDAASGRRSAVRTLAPMLAAALALAGPVACSDERPAARSATATTAATERSETDRRPSSSQLETRPSDASAIRFRGNGDRVLRPIRVGRGGTTIQWTNNGSEPVFSLLTESAIVVDAAFGRSGERFLPPGRYVLEVVASGRWTITVPNASLRR